MTRKMTLAQAKEQGWGEQAPDFVAWWNKVDDRCVIATGLGLLDFPDWNFADAFVDCMGTEDAFEAFAEDVLAELGFEL